jgi:hypothetical protein
VAAFRRQNRLIFVPPFPFVATGTDMRPRLWRVNGDESPPGAWLFRIVAENILKVLLNYQHRD